MPSSWLSIGVAQTFPWPGKRSLRAEVAVLGTRQMEAEAQRARLSAESQVTLAYLDLQVIVPITLVLIFGLLYLNTKSSFKAGLVMLAVPFSAVGAIWLLYLLGYNVSIAVWVGLIALMGLDAEPGTFMLLFLDLAHDEAKTQGRLRTRDDLVEAIIHGAIKRVRPKAMTVCAAGMGLLPIMWATGTGSDLMKRIAAPMVGELSTSFAMELLVYPAIYFLWRRKEVIAKSARKN
jgi:Cu(I)/Ag(I) efflux system membrane protein CusA/SilA